jgi:hypothetical protein
MAKQIADLAGSGILKTLFKVSETISGFGA